MPITFYNSVREFTDSLPDASQDSNLSRWLHQNGNSWAGGYDYNDSKDRIWQGNSKAIKKSAEILDLLEENSIEVETSQLELERVGGYPCVPAFIAGSPESMFAMTAVNSDLAPLRIYAGVCLSAGFGAEQLLQRGAAILSLTRKLGMIRPVELWAYSDMEGVEGRFDGIKDGYGGCAIPMVKIETSPLDLATASYILADAGFLRRLCFAWGYPRGFRTSWAWSIYDDVERSQKLRTLCKMNEQDIIINSSCLGYSDLSDPIKWVNEQVKKYLQAQDA